MRFQCPLCNHQYSANERLRGRTTRCPNCEKSIRIPLEETAQPAAAVVPIGSVKTFTKNAQESLKESTSEATEVRAGVKRRVSSVEVKERFKTEEKNAVAHSHEVEEDEDEGMVVFKKGKVVKDEIDMTAMVDVTFLLLIFFMVTSSFTSEKAIQQKPSVSDKSSSKAVEKDPENTETVKVLIDEFNAYTIIFPDGDEQEATSKQELISVLAMAQLEGSSDDATTFAVTAHEDCIHATVIGAIDAGREKGFSQFIVNVVENFD